MFRFLGVILRLLLTSVVLPVAIGIVLFVVLFIMFFKQIALGFLIVVLVYCAVSEAVDAINRHWAKARGSEPNEPE